MPAPIPSDYDLFRRIIDFGKTPEESDADPSAAAEAVTPLVDLGLPWPAGFAPTPQPMNPKPMPSDPLPKADILVVTWTVAEVEALADTLTPGTNRKNWYPYNRNFDAHYRPLIRKGAPSLAKNVERLGSYFMTKIGNKKVLCMKSELHLNQDGIATAPGKATLPVKDFFQQMIDEVQPSLVITAGTAGAVFGDHELGDVIVTRGAKFRLRKEFKNETFADTAYKCDTFTIPTGKLNDAKTLLAKHADRLKEPDFGPPTKAYKWTGPLVPGVVNSPDLKIDGVAFQAFHPILTTDFFEFGNSVNKLETIGCGVEMGDAVLGLVVKEMIDAGKPAPNWLVIRNASDPQINGDLPTEPRATNMQAHWAVWYYETYGYWTSVSSSIATWAVIAGLP